MQWSAWVPYVATAGTFVVVLALAFAVRVLLNPERTARDRVADLTGGPMRQQQSLLVQDRREQPSGMTWKVGQLARPQDQSEAEQLRDRLLQAGYRSGHALELYSAVRVLLALALGGLGLAVGLGQHLATIYTAFFALAGFTLGYYLPSVYLDMRVRRRQERLIKSFPDALDLLVSSVEAGLGLDAAFRRVADEMESAAPELARELQMVNHEVAAGVPRVEALRHLDRRTGLDEVNSLVNVLMQAERFGTSVARALRIHSELVRKKRMLAAEEKAAAISPKLTVVMILFIFPMLFIVLVGPAVISVMRNLLPTMAGN